MSENFYYNTQTAFNQGSTPEQPQQPQQHAITETANQSDFSATSQQQQSYQNIGLKTCPTAYEAERKKSMSLQGILEETEAKKTGQTAQTTSQHNQMQQTAHQSPYQQQQTTIPQPSIPQTQPYLPNSPFYSNMPYQNFIPQPQYPQNINPIGLNNNLSPYINMNINQIDNLVKSGILNAETGLLLKSDILKNTFGNGITSVQAPPQQMLIPQNQQNIPTNPNIFPDAQETLASPASLASLASLASQASNADTTLLNFEQSEPNFFSGTQARNNLKGYLRQVFPTLQQEDLSKIVQIVKDLETQAIEHHSTRSDYAKNLNVNNILATKKLSGIPDKQKTSNVTSTKVFTRADIAAMSMEEFKTHHEEILSQYRKHLIK